MRRAEPGKPVLLGVSRNERGIAYFVKVACLSDDGRINYVAYFHLRPNGKMKSGKKYPLGPRGENADIPYPIWRKLTQLAGSQIRLGRSERPRPENPKLSQLDLFD
ncbi:MAG: hypothetical protein Q8O87_01835 [bacterium]|nr:hypothetical protein [bacterium]